MNTKPPLSIRLVHSSLQTVISLHSHPPITSPFVLSISHILQLRKSPRQSSRHKDFAHISLFPSLHAHSSHPHSGPNEPVLRGGFSPLSYITPDTLSVLWFIWGHRRVSYIRRAVPPYVFTDALIDRRFRVDIHSFTSAYCSRWQRSVFLTMLFKYTFFTFKWPHKRWPINHVASTSTSVWCNRKA